MDTILWPLKVVVSWIMVYIHKALVFIGMSDGPGLAWVLSIVGLTVVVRIVIMPLFVRQIRASRGMQLMQPELQALQAKYKGKKDPESKRKQQEEMMALYRKHKANPLSSCLPLIIQTPILLALFRVLASLQSLANGTYANHISIGPLTAKLATDIQGSSLFGAHLSDSFMNSSDMTTKVVTVIMIICMSLSQWYTMAQLTMKNMPESTKNSSNPMIKSQRLMMWIMPIFFAFTGINFQIGVLVYWLTTNVWTLGQQFFAIRNMPAPGSEAEKKYRARVNAKRARKGLPSLEEEEAEKRALEREAAGKSGGQRVQPVRKDRQKKNNTTSASHHESTGTENGENSQIPETNTVGLTAEEIARRRYEKRARQRQQRKKNSAKKRQR